MTKQAPDSSVPAIVSTTWIGNWTLIAIGIGTFLLLSLFCKSLRYGLSRRLVLNLFCWVQGRRPVWVEDPNLARRILQASSSKGNCIEQLISLRQFHPILSLESVDGEQWRRMKKAFLVLKTHLPPLALLHSITDEAVNRCVRSFLVIDCPALVQLIFDIMARWLFDRELGLGNFPIVVEGVEECRKALSIKGDADSGAKSELIAWMKRMIRESKYYDVFGARWEEPEYWSLFLQPFFVSPAINLVDMAVTLYSEPFRRRLTLPGAEGEGGGPIVLTHATIVDAINFSHPFPVLERWFPEGLQASKDKGHTFLIEPRTHVFLPMDEIGRRLSSDGVDDSQFDGNKNFCSAAADNQWAAFGGGKRACAGQDIAFVLASRLFSPLLTYNAEIVRAGYQPRFRPSEGKTFSGRENDLRETWAQTLFQVRLLILITFKLVKRRLTTLLLHSHSSSDPTVQT